MQYESTAWLFRHDAPPAPEAGHAPLPNVRASRHLSGVGIFIRWRAHDFLLGRVCIEDMSPAYPLQPSRFPGLSRYPRFRFVAVPGSRGFQPAIVLQPQERIERPSHDYKSRVLTAVLQGQTAHSYPVRSGPCHGNAEIGASQPRSNHIKTNIPAARRGQKAVP